MNASNAMRHVKILVKEFFKKKKTELQTKRLVCGYATLPGVDGRYVEILFFIRYKCNKKVSGFMDYWIKGL